ncbi:MAG TPA: hypothetical protein VNS34_05695 [Rhizobiaceae bacterium]|nr:hypothetical protein [Rhizobiaceae bacterium]
MALHGNDRDACRKTFWSTGQGDGNIGRSNSLGCMSRLDREIARLAQVTEHITEGEVRVLKQRMLVERLRVDNHDTKRAEQYLDLLNQILATWLQHRDLVETRMALLTTTESLGHHGE